jgi:hypothetical protein
MSSHDAALAANNRRIAGLAAKFQGHTGLDRALLLHWLGQFRAEHIDLALRVLESVTYFTRRNVKALGEQVVDDAFAFLGDIPRQKVLFVIAADMWDGDVLVARVLRYGGQLPQRQLTQYAHLSSMHAGEWEAVVLLKDFVGTGGQLARWWTDTLEALVLPLEAEVVFGILVLNSLARQRLQPLGPSVVAACELGAVDNVFHGQCNLFSQEEKSTILDYCEQTGAPTHYVRGYGDNGLMVAFDHGCPNNSIPILWYNSESWVPLFSRHGWP